METSLVEVHAHILSLHRVLDYGGQRGERRKWIPALTGQVDAVIFVTALSGYTQQLREDKNVVRVFFLLFYSRSSYFAIVI